MAGKIWHGEMTNHRQDGSLYVQETTIIPVQDNQGATNHFIAIGLDVTEQRKTEAQLRQAQKMEYRGTSGRGRGARFQQPAYYHQRLWPVAEGPSGDETAHCKPIAKRFYRPGTGPQA